MSTYLLPQLARPTTGSVNPLLQVSTSRL